MSSVRRVFYYLVSLVTLGILAGGVGNLLALIFDITLSSPATVGQSGFSREQLSLGIAMLVIGGPLWLVFWRNIQNHVKNDPTESGANLRHFYLNLILVVTALTAVSNAIGVFQWLLAGLPDGRNPAGNLGALIVTALIWWYHWRIAVRDGLPTRAAGTLRRWYLYFAAGWGLVVFSFGVVQMVNTLTASLTVWGNALTGSGLWPGPVAAALPSVVLGGGFWAWHWFNSARTGTDSSLRQVYLYLLALMGSSIAGLSALVVGIYRTLLIVMRATGETPVNLQYLGWVIPTLVVSCGIWLYHQAVTREEAADVQTRRLSSRRVHFHIMAFIGLGALTYGLIALLGTVINLLINVLQPALVIEPYWWQQQLSLSLALLIAAIPLWLYYWDRLTRLAASGGVTEWRARSRRIYLYTITGAAIISLATALVNIIYQVLSGLLGGSTGAEILRRAAWAIQALIVVLPLLVYHWRIIRTDQRRGAEAAAAQKNLTALIDPLYRAWIDRLAERSGIRLRVLEITGAAREASIQGTFSGEAAAESASATVEPGEAELERIAAEIENSPTRDLVLIVHQGRLTVLPVREKSPPGGR